MKQPDVVQARHDSGDEVAGRIVEAVAQEVGEDAAALSPPLFDVVDPEAIAALVDHEGFDGTVAFTYAGHRVVVHGDGGLDVEPVEA